MLSDNIRKCRKAKQMSQDELAEKLGVTRQSISLWETGQTQPSLDNIVALAKLFDVSTDALLTDQNPASANAVEAGMPWDKPEKKKPIAAIVIGAVLVAALVTVVLCWKAAKPQTPAAETVGTEQEMPQSTEPQKPQTPATEVTGGEPEAPQTPTPEEPQTPTPEAPQTPATEAPQSTEPQKPQAPATETPEKEEESQSAAASAEKDLYSYLKDFVIQKGTVNGDYSYFSKTADHYGGYASEDFSLYYWGDTKTVEFCLHSVLDETFSINFYLRVPAKNNGEYEYISSYYYRDTGAPLYEAKGVIRAKEFTKSFPLDCDKYIGSTEVQTEFMEMSREGICDLIACLEKFVAVEKLEYSFADFGFAKF